MQKGLQEVRRWHWSSEGKSGLRWEPAQMGTTQGRDAVGGDENVQSWTGEVSGGGGREKH